MMSRNISNVDPAAFELAADWAVAAGLLVPLWSESQSDDDDDDSVRAPFRFVGEVGTSAHYMAMNDQRRLEGDGWAWERDVDQNVWMMAPELFSIVDRTGDFWLNDCTPTEAEEAAYMFRRTHGLDVNTGEPE